MLVKEDMKKIAQISMLRSRSVAARNSQIFGVPLLELREQGLLEDGVPLVVKRMVEHLRRHGKRKLYKEFLLLIA